MMVHNPDGRDGSKKETPVRKGTEKGIFFVGDSEEEGIVTIVRCNPFFIDKGW